VQLAWVNTVVSNSERMSFVFTPFWRKLFSIGLSCRQGCEVVTSRRFLGGVGFLTTLGVGVGFFCPTPDVQLEHFLHRVLKLGIPVEMDQFLLNLSLKQRFLAVHHDFH